MVQNISDDKTIILKMLDRDLLMGIKLQPIGAVDKLKSISEEADKEEESLCLVGRSRWWSFRHSYTG